jgi:hypothetical protein
MVTVLEPKIDRGPTPDSSDRSFGFVFAVVFAVIAAWPLYYGGAPRWGTTAIAVAFALVALVRPKLLRPLNRTWLVLGRLVHMMVSPLVMGLIFFLCVAPIGFILRRRRDVLSLKRRPDLSSYWVAREPTDPQSMKHQF